LIKTLQKSKSKLLANSTLIKQLKKQECDCFVEGEDLEQHEAKEVK
jgi:hypothetical protein